MTINTHYQVSGRSSLSELRDEGSSKAQFVERKMNHLTMSSLFQDNESEQGVLKFVEESQTLMKVLRQKNLLTPHSSLLKVKEMVGDSYIKDFIVDGHHQQLNDVQNEVHTQDSGSTCFADTPTDTWLKNNQKNEERVSNILPDDIAAQKGSVKSFKLQTPNHRVSFGKNPSTPIAVVTPIKNCISPRKASTKENTKEIPEAVVNFASKCGNTHLYRKLIEMNSLACSDRNKSDNVTPNCPNQTDSKNAGTLEPLTNKVESSITNQTESRNPGPGTFEAFKKNSLKAINVSVHKYFRIKKRLRKEKKAKKHLQKQLNVACLGNSSFSEGFKNNSEDVVKLMTLSSLCPHVIYRETNSEPPASTTCHKSECDCPCICEKDQPRMEKNLELRYLLSSMTPTLTPILKSDMCKLLEESHNKQNRSNIKFSSVNCNTNSSSLIRHFGESVCNGDGDTNNINTNGMGLLAQQSTSQSAYKSVKNVDGKENWSYNNASLE